VSRCRYCQQRIRFATLPTGHQIPYDPDPHWTGTLILERARSESGVELAVRRAVFVSMLDRAGEPHYRPHRQTCTARAARRRRRGGRRASRAQSHFWEAS
jgi:hypothetical protein